MANGNVTHCRLCAELKPTTTVVDIETQIEEIVSKLSRINANADLSSGILPKTVCIKCMISLNGAYEFVLAVERAQHTLSNMTKDIKQELNDDLQGNYEFGVPDTLLQVKFEPAAAAEERESSSLPSAGENISLLERVLKYGTVSPASTIELPDNDTEVNDEKDTKVKVKKSFKRKKCPTPQLLDPPSTWNEYIWKCSVCDTEFPTHEEMKTHSMEFHKICNVQKCYDCNLRRGTLDHFIMHVRRHRTHLKYSCYICSKVVSSPHEAGLHRRIHRTTPHICKGCNTTFKNEKQLREHMTTYFRQICERNASKIVERTCKVCAKSFDNALSLMRHVQVHTERKKNYTCETCGKCFHNKHVLKGHMTVHTDERPFPCDICDQRFKCRNHLLGHLQTHITPRQHTCDVCNRSFKFKKHLETHQIVHTNLLPHVCNYCNKGFRFKSVLNQHLRQHTGVKSYTCSICHRQFTGWPNYNKHMKRRHNMNMSKRNLVIKNEEISESMKEYVETVCNEKKRGKKLKKLLAEVTDQAPSENLEHS